jgi:hypothetical protein
VSEYGALARRNARRSYIPTLADVESNVNDETKKARSTRLFKKTLEGKLILRRWFARFSPIAIQPNQPYHSFGKRE